MRSQQGQLQGANNSILGLTGPFGSILFTLVFSQFIGPSAFIALPSAPFILAAALMAISAALAVRVSRPSYKETISTVVGEIVVDAEPSQPP